MEKNEKAIYNNWGLMEYLNNIDVNSLNFEIGKYLYENRNNIEKMTVDEIAEKGCFSQSSISRFFSKNGFDSFKEYKNINLYKLNETEKAYAEYKEKHSDINELILHMEHIISDSMDVLKKMDINAVLGLAEDLMCANRILFTGYSLCANAFKVTQIVLAYKNYNVYAPNNYYSQKELIKKMKNKDDLIIYSTLTSEWYHDGFDNFMDGFMHKTDAKTYLISTQPVMDSNKWFNKVITLDKDKKEKMFDGEYLCLYFFDILLSTYLMHI